MFVIDNPVNNILHIVRFVRIGRNNFVQGHIRAAGGIGRFSHGRVGHVIGRNKADQFTDHHQGLFFIFTCKMGDPAFGAVRDRASKFFFADLLMSDHADNFGPGHEHMTGFIDHKNKIGQRRRIDGPSGTRP